MAYFHYYHHNFIQKFPMQTKHWAISISWPGPHEVTCLLRGWALWMSCNTLITKLLHHHLWTSICNWTHSTEHYSTFLGFNKPRYDDYSFEDGYKKSILYFLSRFLNWTILRVTPPSLGKYLQLNPFCWCFYPVWDSTNPLMMITLAGRFLCRRR